MQEKALKTASPFPPHPPTSLQNDRAWPAPKGKDSKDRSRIHPPPPKTVPCTAQQLHRCARLRQLTG